MSRSIEQIKAELGTVKIRLNMLVAESESLNERGKKMTDRKFDLVEELEKAENA